MSATLTELPFSRVAIDAEATELPYTIALLARLGGRLPVAVLAPGEVPTGKGTLFVTIKKGAFLKECPCTPGAARCGYLVFSPLTGCPFSCSYCFLRFYSPDEPLTVFANVEDAEREFAEWASALTEPVRLGTGEFADSLALDHVTQHGEWLAGLAARFPLVQLELKTKAANPAHLLNLPSLPNLVAAWSVNPPGLATEERGAAPIAERLAAAGEVAATGRSVGFHFDPVIVHPGWREGYAKLVRDIFTNVNSGLVRWISLGTLRFPRRFMDSYGPRLAGNPHFFAEFVPGEDGKLRYPWFERREVYKFLTEEILRRGGPGVKVYLCMEPPAMWRAVFGEEPAEGEIGPRLAQ